jgi:hypothetical protein
MRSIPNVTLTESELSIDEDAKELSTEEDAYSGPFSKVTDI